MNKKYEIILFDGGNVIVDRNNMNIIDQTISDKENDWTALLKKNGFSYDKYVRNILAEDGSTRIDFGSWSHFIYIKELA